MIKYSTMYLNLGHREAPNPLDPLHVYFLLIEAMVLIHGPILSGSL